MTRIVNAAATLTRLGGSIMPPSVVAAMAEAATRYVDLPAEYVRVGARIAALTGNEDAAVTAGAAAALTLVVAAAVTGPDPVDLEVFPHIPAARPDRVVMPAPQRNAYDYAVRMLGLTVVDADPRDMAAAIDERTACVLWFAGNQYPTPGVTLPDIVAAAGDVPVVVDAAAQVPPVSSLHAFTRGAGAAAAIFSGGKGLRGPQTTGLVVGRRDLVRGVRAHAAPQHGVGRGMKVGKEELAGLLAAVEHALGIDEPALLAGYEAVVAEWVEGLRDLVGGPLASVTRSYPSEAGQPHGRAELTTAEDGPTGDDLVARLWAGDPQVAVLATGPHSVALNPQPLAPGEETVVLAAVRRALAPSRGGPTVLVTGSSGVVGRVLMDGLRDVRLIPFDRPRHDARDPDQLDAVLPGLDCVLHLAWNTCVENFLSGRLDPDNARMTHTVLSRSLHHGVGRVVLAGSVHADLPPDRDPTYVSDPRRTGIPDSPYGASKVFGEALGAYFATRGLDVINLRLGGINAEDRRPGDAVERSTWISHRDWVALVQACVDAPAAPGRYVCVNAVSANEGGWHDLDNPLGWVPRDGCS